MRTETPCVQSVCNGHDRHPHPSVSVACNWVLMGLFLVQKSRFSIKDNDKLTADECKTCNHLPLLPMDSIRSPESTVGAETRVAG